MNGMTLRIDKGGRVVLPKPVRDHLRLIPGSNLELEERAEGIVLRPVKRRASLVEKDGLLVHRGEAPPGLDSSRLVEDCREERVKDASGL
jgi:AbrB family looped-hinge helix DNA binding protein